MRRVNIVSFVLACATCATLSVKAAEISIADQIANSMEVKSGPALSRGLAATEQQHFNDVWAFNLDTSAWEEILPAGFPPPPMRNHSMAYDPLRHRMIVIGGISSSGGVNGIWSLDLTHGAETWSPDGPTTGFFPTTLHGRDIKYNPATKSLVCAYTAYSGSQPLFLWNLETNISETFWLSPCPGVRAFSALVLDEARNRLLLYGGGDAVNAVRDDLWALDLTPGSEAWTLLPRKGDAPPPKWLLRSTIDPVRETMILYGGNSFPNFTDGDYRDTTYELDLTSDTWKLVPTLTPPSARGQYAAVWDPVTRRQYVFGGLYRVGPNIENVITYNEIWVYDSDTQSWFQEVPVGAKPEIRRTPNAILDPVNRRIIVFGGEMIRSTTASLQAAIKVPRNGRKIGGNRVTIMAEIVAGSPADVREVRFQYRQPSIIGTWVDIPAAGANHPNPDSTSPYFVHWDVTGMPPGDVDLRAVAASLTGVIDSAPDDIVVTIDHANPQTFETTNSDGHVVLSYVVEPSGMNDIAVSDDRTSTYTNAVNANVRLRIPGDTLTTGTAVTVTFADLGQYPELDPQGGAIGFVASITVPPGQEVFPPGKTVTLVFHYPDGDQNGIVDNTTIHESTLSIFTPDGFGGLEELENIQVDTVGNWVQGETSHFSLFVVSGNPSNQVPEWMLLR